MLQQLAILLKIVCVERSRLKKPYADENVKSFVRILVKQMKVDDSQWPLRNGMDGDEQYQPGVLANE